MTMIAEAPTGLRNIDLIDRCISRTIGAGAPITGRRAQLQFDDLDELLAELPLTPPARHAAAAFEEDAERWDGLS